MSNKRRTRVGLALIITGLITILATFAAVWGNPAGSFSLVVLVALIAPLVMAVGLLFCLLGANGRARAALLASLAGMLASVAMVVFSAEAMSLFTRDDLRGLSALAVELTLLSSSTALFLLYAAALSAQLGAQRLRTVFWLLVLCQVPFSLSVWGKSLLDVGPNPFLVLVLGPWIVAAYFALVSICLSFLTHRLSRAPQIPFQENLSPSL